VADFSKVLAGMAAGFSDAYGGTKILPGLMAQGKEGKKRQERLRDAYLELDARISGNQDYADLREAVGYSGHKVSVLTNSAWEKGLLDLTKHEQLFASQLKNRDQLRGLTNMLKVGTERGTLGATERLQINTQISDLMGNMQGLSPMTPAGSSGGPGGPGGQGTIEGIFSATAGLVAAPFVAIADMFLPNGTDIEGKLQDTGTVKILDDYTMGELDAVTEPTAQPGDAMQPTDEGRPDPSVTRVTRIGNSSPTVAEWGIFLDRAKGGDLSGFTVEEVRFMLNGKDSPYFSKIIGGVHNDALELLNHASEINTKTHKAAFSGASGLRDIREDNLDDFAAQVIAGELTPEAVYGKDPETGQVHTRESRMKEIDYFQKMAVNLARNVSNGDEDTPAVEVHDSSTLKAFVRSTTEGLMYRMDQESEYPIRDPQGKVINKGPEKLAAMLLDYKELTEFYEQDETNLFSEDHTLRGRLKVLYNETLDEFSDAVNVDPRDYSSVELMINTLPLTGINPEDHKAVLEGRAKIGGIVNKRVMDELRLRQSLHVAAGLEGETLPTVLSKGLEQGTAAYRFTGSITTGVQKLLGGDMYMAVMAGLRSEDGKIPEDAVNLFYPTFDAETGAADRAELTERLNDIVKGLSESHVDDDELDREDFLYDLLTQLANLEGISLPRDKHSGSPNDPYEVELFKQIKVHVIDAMAEVWSKSTVDISVDDYFNYSPENDQLTDRVRDISDLLIDNTHTHNSSLVDAMTLPVMSGSNSFQVDRKEVKFRAAGQKPGDDDIFSPEKPRLESVGEGLSVGLNKLLGWVVSGGRFAGKGAVRLFRTEDEAEETIRSMETEADSAAEALWTKLGMARDEFYSILKDIKENPSGWIE
jgi:hypothetical protein